MLVSIITVNLNNLDGLKKTAESILAQNCDLYEWIVIDGGSSDGSPSFIKENEQDITYWVSEPDSGIYEAMNKGIDASSGDYLLFLNSGDSLADSDIVDSFFGTKPSADVLYGNSIFVDKTDKEVGRYIAPDFVRLSYFWGHTLNHQGTFFNKRCFDQFRYNETNRIASDLELFMQLLYSGYSFEKWDRFVDRFEVGGLSSQKNKDEFGNILIRLLPPGVLADYKDFIQFRDVDLFQTTRRIVDSKRWVRNLARIALLPFKLFLK